jgi:hypothetical protein
MYAAGLFGCNSYSVGKLPDFADPEVSLPFCQKLSTVPHPQLNQVKQSIGIQFLKILLGIIRSSTPSCP